MSTYTVIALDPGGSTGYAVYQAEKPSQGEISFEAAPRTYRNEKWFCGTLGPEEHHHQLDVLLGHYHTQEYHIVCESFEFRNTDRRDRAGINLVSREYIGVVKRYGQERLGKPINMCIVFQTAGQAKPFVTDDKLKVMGLWIPGREHRHEMDARRHLVYYLVNRQGRTDLIQLWKNLK